VPVLASIVNRLFPSANYSTSLGLEWVVSFHGAGGRGTRSSGFREDCSWEHGRGGKDKTQGLLDLMARAVFKTPPKGLFDSTRPNLRSSSIANDDVSRKAWAF
jgi:hypothetical protein